MKITTCGDREKEAILLLHPMLTGAFFFDLMAGVLSGGYFLVIPTFSGHYEGSAYHSSDEEIAEIERFLKENRIERLKAVVGFSMGGNIAFRFFCRNADRIGRAVIDSAPLFRFPAFVKSYFVRNYVRCLQKVKNDPDHAAEELNRCFNGMGEVQSRTAPLVTEESLKNMVTESCYHVTLPALDPDAQRKIIFLYGSKDIARLCVPRLRKYKESRVVRLPSYSHCGYFMENPAEYAEKFVL